MDAVWNLARTEFAFPRLMTSRAADTVIIGGGITGLATAFSLLEAGKHVVVLEALRLADGSTGRSTGNLYGTLSTGLAQLHRKYKADTVRDVVHDRLQAIDFIERTVKRLQIDCDFARRPMYLCAHQDNDESSRRLQQESDAANAAGLVCVPPGRQAELPSFMQAARMDGQAQFNPLAYVQGLARAVTALGGEIYEHSRVTKLDPSTGIVSTESGEVKADDFVYATHTPKGINLLQAEMQPYQEYGVAARVPAGEDSLWEDGIYWVLDEGKSIRRYQRGDQRYLVIIGGKHKTGHGGSCAESYQMLKDYARSHFRVEDFDYEWSAQQFIAADLLPYIGRSAHSNVHVATGFAADGLVWGVVAADVLCRQILGKDLGMNHYSPWRFTPLKSAKNWIEENKTVLKHLLKGHVHPDKRSLEQVAPGEGVVMEVDGDKLAVHRSDSGELTVLSAQCPHMKCLVHWNEADSTWDCPCHGSRFSREGEVLEGPAYEGLATRQAVGEESP